MLSADAADNITDILGAVGQVFTALEHEGSKIQLISDIGAFENLFTGQVITLGLHVAFPYSTVIAVIFAVAGKFNDTPQVHLVSVILLPDFPGVPGQKFFLLRIHSCKQSLEIIPGKYLLFPEPADSVLIVHKILCPCLSVNRHAVNSATYHINPPAPLLCHFRRGWLPAAGSCFQTDGSFAASSENSGSMRRDRPRIPRI